MPITLEGFREMALSFPETFEGAHMGHPDFRIRGGKIFATLWPKESWGVVILTPEQQEGFIATAPAMFVAVKGGWGRRGCTHVILKKASKRTLKVALAVAWRNAAPKRLIAQGARSLIRAEEPGDRPAIFRVLRDAFGRDDEARLVDALRASDAFIPELSLVALDGAAIVGHVLFTRVGIRDEDASHAGLALAPVAVAPSHQGKGVGSALIRRALEEAGALGHSVVIVLGHPEYYPRFGFVPAQARGIRAPFPVNDRSFMALALRPGGLDGIRGIVEYAAPFTSVKVSARS